MFTENQLFEIFGYYEKDRFIHVKGDYIYNVRCHHPEPVAFSNSQSYIPSSRLNESTVGLRQYALKNDKLGLAGKCETCGKVYYK